MAIFTPHLIVQRGSFARTKIVFLLLRTLFWAVQCFWSLALLSFSVACDSSRQFPLRIIHCNLCKISKGKKVRAKACSQEHECKQLFSAGRVKCRACTNLCQKLVIRPTFLFFHFFFCRAISFKTVSNLASLGNYHGERKKQNLVQKQRRKW